MLMLANNNNNKTEHNQRKKAGTQWICVCSSVSQSVCLSLSRSLCNCSPSAQLAAAAASASPKARRTRGKQTARTRKEATNEQNNGAQAAEANDAFARREKVACCKRRSRVGREALYSASNNVTAYNEKSQLFAHCSTQRAVSVQKFIVSSYWTDYMPSSSLNRRRPPNRQWRWLAPMREQSTLFELDRREQTRLKKSNEDRYAFLFLPCFYFICIVTLQQYHS